MKITVDLIYKKTGVKICTIKGNVDITPLVPEFVIKQIIKIGKSKICTMLKEKGLNGTIIIDNKEILEI